MPTLRLSKFALLVVTVFPLAALSAPADDVKALLDQGKATEAYALGKTHTDQLGNPAFDFYYGVAAIDVGHAGEGVLALERYLINFPDNTNARLELARGYFVLGEDMRAREEFEGIMKIAPPAAVQANIQRFLDAIRARESRYKTTAGFFVEAGIGFDDNVNGGVGEGTVSLPGFGSFLVGPGTAATADSFTHVAVGGQVNHPVSPGVALFGSAQWDAKLHQNDNDFDQTNLSLAGGVSYLKDKNLLRGTLSFVESTMENDRFRDLWALTGEWHYQWDELQTLSAFAQYATLDYTVINQAIQGLPTDNTVRDSTLSVVGAGWRKAFIHPWQPLLSATLSFGQEDNQKNREDLSRDIYSARLAASATPAPKWSLSGGLSYTYSSYAAAGFGGLLSIREDHYYAADVAAGYAFTKNWSTRGELLVSRNDSNIALNEFDRSVLAFKLRYEY